MRIRLELTEDATVFSQAEWTSILSVAGMQKTEQVVTGDRAPTLDEAHEIIERIEQRSPTLAAHFGNKLRDAQLGWLALAPYRKLLDWMRTFLIHNDPGNYLVDVAEPALQILSIVESSNSDAFITRAKDALRRILKEFPLRNTNDTRHSEALWGVLHLIGYFEVEEAKPTLYQLWQLDVYKTLLFRGSHSLHSQIAATFSSLATKHDVGYLRAMISNADAARFCYEAAVRHSPENALQLLPVALSTAALRDDPSDIDGIWDVFFDCCPASFPTQLSEVFNYLNSFRSHASPRHDAITRGLIRACSRRRGFPDLIISASGIRPDEYVVCIQFAAAAQEVSVPLVISSTTYLWYRTEYAWPDMKLLASQNLDYVRRQVSDEEEQS